MRLEGEGDATRDGGGSALDRCPQLRLISHEYDRAYGTRHRRIDQRPVEQLRADDRDDDVLESRALGYGR